MIEGAENIPKEELMHLCMKLNKRMQSMEVKGKDLVKKKNSLLSERHKLIELMCQTSSDLMSTSLLNIKDDSDLDLPMIEDTWIKWENTRKEHLFDLEHRVAPSAETSHTLPSEDLSDLQQQCKKYQIEVDRLKGVDSYNKNQLSSLESVLSERNSLIESQQKEIESLKLNYEEKIVFLQMQLNGYKTKDENRDKELTSLKKQLEKALQQVEEREVSVSSNKEVLQALQNRLFDLEPDLAQCKDRIKELDRLLNAPNMMKAEQDALVQYYLYIYFYV